MLLNYDIYRVADKSSELPPRQFRFDIKKIGVPILHLAGDTEKAILRWIEVLKDAVEQLKMTDNWLQRARRNLLLSPGALVKPDCFGYLVKIGDEWKSFNRRYCVLKDACLYFYQDVNAGNAFGELLFLTRKTIIHIPIKYRGCLFAWVQSSTASQRHR